MPDKQGTLTRNEMLSVLQSGKSITFKGQHITHHSQLPSMGELTANSPEDRNIAKQELARRLLALQQEMENLDEFPLQGEIPNPVPPTEFDAVVPSEFGTKDVTEDTPPKQGPTPVHDLP